MFNRHGSLRLGAQAAGDGAYRQADGAPVPSSPTSDAANAEAICEAVGRPSMRFVLIKSIEQQSVLSLHRVRQRFVKARTAQTNQIRGLLGEFGLVVP